MESKFSIKSGVPDPKLIQLVVAIFEPCKPDKLIAAADFDLRMSFGDQLPENKIEMNSVKIPGIFTVINQLTFRAEVR